MATLGRETNTGVQWNQSLDWHVLTWKLIICKERIGAENQGHANPVIPVRVWSSWPCSLLWFYKVAWRNPYHSGCQQLKMSFWFSRDGYFSSTVQPCHGRQLSSSEVEVSASTIQGTQGDSRWAMTYTWAISQSKGGRLTWRQRSQALILLWVPEGLHEESMLFSQVPSVCFRMGLMHTCSVWCVFIRYTLPSTAPQWIVSCSTARGLFTL